MYLEKIESYWNTRAKGYSISVNKELLGNEREIFKNILSKCAPEGEKIKCLDLGCGPGFFSILLKEMNFDVTAMDYSDEMLEQARENFKYTGVEIETIKADAQNLPFENESFDYVVSRNLVWDLEYPDLAYKEWIRVLKPGGKILVVDGNHYLYYFDDDYKVNRSTNERLIYGVDPTVINEIAKDLPMSKVLRPKWDIDTLLSLGVSSITTEVKHREIQDPKTNEKKNIITDFYISAEKPSYNKKESLKEEQRKINEEWSNDSDNYSRIIIDELNSFRVSAWTELIEKYAPQKSTLDILDCGCGPGFFSIVLSKAGHRVVGVDGAKGMLEHACENAKAYGANPIFINGDCHNLPFCDNSFDLIVSRNLTHALVNHNIVYSEWIRVLRPKGILLIFDANWHLMNTDPVVREDFAKREDECFEIYGNNFCDGRRQKYVCYDNPYHRLGTVHRPEWDVNILRNAGFTNIFYKTDIADKLWDDKEKLLHGATPMFMISAEKPE